MYIHTHKYIFELLCSLLLVGGGTVTFRNMGAKVNNSS